MFSKSLSRTFLCKKMIVFIVLLYWEGGVQRLKGSFCTTASFNHKVLAVLPTFRLHHQRKYQHSKKDK